MTTTIVVAGATGNLGKRITKALLGRGANVVALTRVETEADKIKALEESGAKVAVVDMSSAAEIARVCAGADCMVSAIQGLHNVIVEAQAVLLESAITAGVSRFIPSDFCTDFTRLPEGENRNFDLRREFHKRLDVASIASTSIFNGAFGEILTYNVPLLDFAKKTVGYWEDPDWLIDFTTMDDTAAYTAATALDPTTPRALKIASFQISPNDLVKFTAETLKTPFTLVRMGSLDDLRLYNKRERAAHPEGENELYASWQQTQYMQSMFSTHHQSLDNARYPNLAWTKLQDAIGKRS